MTTSPQTFVLVPGAWLGAWVWQDVAEGLRARGHRVVPLTLPGLAERAHEATAATDLDVHIDDVVARLEADDLTRVVLVGHSYAGTVVTGVADRAADRLAGLVYVDSAPIEGGTRMLDVYPPEAVEALEASLLDGWRWPFPGWEVLGADTSLDGLDEHTRALVAERATPHPFGTYRSALRLDGSGDHLPRAVIACDEMQALAAGPLAFLTRPPWRYRELATGHWPMLSAPAALVDHLDEVGTELAEAAAS